MIFSVLEQVLFRYLKVIFTPVLFFFKLTKKCEQMLIIMKTPWVHNPTARKKRGLAVWEKLSHKGLIDDCFETFVDLGLGATNTTRKFLKIKYRCTFAYLQFLSESYSSFPSTKQWTWHTILFLLDTQNFLRYFSLMNWSVKGMKLKKLVELDYISRKFTRRPSIWNCCLLKRASHPKLQ